MSIVDWPSPRLAPLDIDIRPVNQTRSAGRSLTGFEQTAEPITQRWAMSLQFNNLKRQFIPAWRAMIAALNGRSNVLRLPVFDPEFQPADELLGLGTSTHSDGTAFGDGSLYQTLDISGISASGASGSKQISIDFDIYGQALDGGQYFGIGSETYLAKKALYSGNVATIDFEPGLRQTHSSSVVRLRPIMLTRLATDDEGRLPLTRGIVGAPSLELIEVLPGELSAEELAQL